MAGTAATTPDTVAPPRRRGLTGSRGFTGFVFLLPAALLLLVFLTYPLGLGIWLGFTDARIGRAGTFVRAGAAVANAFSEDAAA